MFSRTVQCLRFFSDLVAAEVVTNDEIHSRTKQPTLSDTIRCLSSSFLFWSSQLR